MGMPSQRRKTRVRIKLCKQIIPQNYRVTDIVEGQMVAARYEEGDSMFYRAKVLGEMPDGKVDLYFVDFGDNTYAEKQEIFRLR